MKAVESNCKYWHGTCNISERQSRNRKGIRSLTKTEKTGCRKNQKAINRTRLQDIEHIAVYEVELEQGAAESAHVHEGPQVTYVVEGSIDLHLEDQIVPMLVGDSILVPSGQAHSAFAKEHAKLICIR